jgi:hypothetical protein
MITSIWIVGVGPVLYDKQFATDLPRLYPRQSLNGTVLPKDVYDSIRLIYEVCGTQYYRYTKYINQTMGNTMMTHLRKLYPNKHIIAIRGSYKVNAYYKPCSKYIDSTLDVKILNTDLSYHHTIGCKCKYDLDDSRVLVKIHRGTI